MTRIIDTVALDYSDILIKPKMGKNLNSRSEVKLTREFRFKHGETRKGIPIMSANMFTVGNFKTAKELLKKGMFPTLHKFYTVEEISNFYKECRNENISTDNLFISIGLRDYEKELEKLKKLYIYDNIGFSYGKMNICIDAPNFYIPKALEVLKKVRETFPNSVIMVGNVVSSDVLSSLYEYADIVKIGIGPGSVCTTRKITGCGVPMVTAILECADIAHALDGHICADGGIINIGDISKAFCLNADFVMIGGMFAGTDEAEGDIVEKYYQTNEFEYEILEDGGIDPITKKKELKAFKMFYGMSSEKANNELMGGMKDYKAPEGREVLIPYTGKLEKILNHINGGIASACTYIGAISIKQMSKCATIIRVNNQYNKTFGN